MEAVQPFYDDLLREEIDYLKESIDYDGIVAEINEDMRKKGFRR